MTDLNLKDKIAFVTGARRGMGRSHSLLLAKAGAKVIVTDISQEDCQRVVQEIQNQGGEAMALKLDVTDSVEIDEVVKKIIETYGKIDILVNNAGVCPFKPFLELTEEDWDFVLNINLKGYFLTAQRVAKEMIKQKSGAIINIASVAMGQQGVGMLDLVHYCASKGGVVGMTEAMALELAPYNIRVNAIAPGVIETPMISPIKQNEDQLNAMLKRIPMGRVGSAEEISNAVLFLASDLSSYMTGSTVVVDGGWLAC
ncbi:MAG: SDR family NAD(P)-dependent oxidoreductase [Candidatus Pacebacteria bacterium]|nr:SDR family NAD(P)-dependent oxidoreductase [Candidatus Paceibacterota bacterium]